TPASPSSLLLSLCLCSCPPPPRPLHSFPTRRSSDLGAGGRPSSAARTRQDPLAGGHLLSANNATGCRPILSLGPHPARPAGKDRSEVHTSELQSRFDLVCRLLLEKKKAQTRLIITH